MTIRPLMLSMFTVVLFGLAGPAFAGGPVVLMGIDAEDGGLGAHGPVMTYADVVSSILAHVTNGGSGLLVIGGGKGTVPNDVTDFWNEIGSQVGQAVTPVNGPAAIAAQSFSGFALVVVASSETETPQGGLTDAENNALAMRSGDIAIHVNGGGALLGLAQVGLTDLYGYISGTFDLDVDVEDTISQCEFIDPTAAGMSIGITDALDVCCWHEAYLMFPPFLDVLAFYNSGEFCFLTGSAAAIGGEDVVLPGCGDGVMDPGEECDDANNIDGDGCSATCGIENTPPDCTDMAVTLWPPNHKFVRIPLPEVTDPDGDTVTLTVVGVTQDEPTDGRGDGHTCPDATGLGSDMASVRAERSGIGDGRVYHMSYEADDGLGGVCAGVATVCVPHDRGMRSTCVDQGPIHDSTVCAAPSGRPSEGLGRRALPGARGGRPGS